MNRGTRSVVGLVTLVLLAATGLTGCGTQDAPSAADDVPSLRVSLSRVDDAMAARRFGAAEKLLRALVADVRRARESGDLGAAAATDIIDAARRLLAELADRDTEATDGPTSSPSQDTGDDENDDDPDPRPTRTPTDEPTTQPSSGSTPEPTPDPADPTTSADPTPTADPATEKTPQAAVPDPATPTAAS